MAAAPIIYLANASIKLGTAPGTEYNGSVLTAEVIPTPGEETGVTTLDGIRHTRYGAASYALHLVMAQDWSATGLCTYLWGAAGTSVPFTLQAYGSAAVGSPATPKMAGTCVVQEPQYGGEAETWIEAEVTMAIVGRPVLTTTMADPEQQPAPDDVDIRYPTTGLEPEPDEAELIAA